MPTWVLYSNLSKKGDSAVCFSSWFPAECKWHFDTCHRPVACLLHSFVLHCLTSSLPRLHLLHHPLAPSFPDSQDSDLAKAKLDKVVFTVHSCHTLNVSNLKILITALCIRFSVCVPPHVACQLTFEAHTCLFTDKPHLYFGNRYSGMLYRGWAEDELAATWGFFYTYNNISFIQY